MSRKVIYLASPYSHKSPEVQRWRFEQAVMAMQALWQRGYACFSPIAYTAPIDGNVCGVPYQDWLDFDLRILSACDELWVLDIPGWDASVGVAAEVEAARRLGVPVSLVRIDDHGDIASLQFLATEAVAQHLPCSCDCACKSCQAVVDCVPETQGSV